MSKNSIISFLVLLFISNCSIHGQTPWIEQSYRDIHFPSDNYYVGFYSQTNEDSNLNECISKTITIAQSLLANSIQSEVSSISRNTISSLDSMEGYSETEAFYSEFTAAASAHLVNVHIEHFYDKSTNTVYAIAYTKKSDLSFFCETKLDSNLASLQSKINNINELIINGYKQDAKKILEEAISIELASPVYLAQLISIGKSNSVITTYADELEKYAGYLAKLKSDLSHGIVINIKAQLKVPFNINNDISDRCKGILSNYDCSFSNETQNVDFIVTLDCKTRTSSNTDGVWYAFNDIELSLLRVRDNTFIYKDSFAVKGGSGTEDRAHRKAVEESSKVICSKIIKFIQE